MIVHLQLLVSRTGLTPAAEARLRYPSEVRAVPAREPPTAAGPTHFDRHIGQSTFTPLCFAPASTRALTLITTAEPFDGLTALEALLVQAVAARLAEDELGLRRAVHVLVAHRAVVVLLGHAALRLVLAAGRGGLAGGARVRLADPRVRDVVGRKRRVSKDLLQLAGQEGSGADVSVASGRERDVRTFGTRRARCMEPAGLGDVMITMETERRKES